MLANTRNADELGRVARFADTFGSQSTALYRIGGNSAVMVSQHAEALGKDTIRLAATFGQRGLSVLDKTGTLTFTKFISRGGKMVYKGDLLTLIAKLLLALPTWLLYGIIAFATWLWVPRRLIIALRRRYLAPSASAG